MRLVALFCCFALLFAVIAGCGGSGPEMGSVTGKVTLDGQPLEGATVQFQPVTGEPKSPSSGVTDASGYYELKFTASKDGATIGDHKVTISKTVTTEDANGNEGEEKETLPAKYNTKSDLTATVEAGSQTIDFALDSEGGGAAGK